MEHFLATEIVKGLNDGDLVKVVAYVAIFIFLWVEVRGLKNQVKLLNETIARSFAEGEKRFDHLEENQIKFDYRLSIMEKNK